MTETIANAGWKTSEFWVGVVTMALIALNQSGALGQFKIPVEGMQDIINVAISFIIGRLGFKAVSTAATTTANAKVEVAKAQASAPTASPLQVELTDKK